MAGKLIPQIEEVLAKKDWDEARRTLYEALKAIAASLPQGDVVSISGNPENNIAAGIGTLAMSDNGNLYYKASAPTLKTGWKTVTLT